MCQTASVSSVLRYHRATRAFPQLSFSHTLILFWGALSAVGASFPHVAFSPFGAKQNMKGLVLLVAGCGLQNADVQ